MPSRITTRLLVSVYTVVRAVMNASIQTETMATTVSGTIHFTADSIAQGSAPDSIAGQAQARVKSTK